MILAWWLPKHRSNPHRLQIRSTWKHCILAYDRVLLVHWENSYPEDNLTYPAWINMTHYPDLAQRHHPVSKLFLSQLRP